jgi:hypothetical protein
MLGHGFWGVWLGSGFGVPFAAAEPRISAAVFGLAGGGTLAKAAARITTPAGFLLQSPATSQDERSCSGVPSCA